MMQTIEEQCQAQLVFHSPKMNTLSLLALSMFFMLACTAAERHENRLDSTKRPSLATADSHASGAQLATAPDSVFARTGSRFHVIRDDTDWPEDFDTHVIISRDMNGRIISLIEIPLSMSGDWFLSYRHTFDEAGRTRRYESVFRYFSPCGISETRFTQTWDAATSEPRVTRGVFDSTGQAADTSQCATDQSSATIDGTPLPSISALVAANRMPMITARSQ